MAIPSIFWPDKDERALVGRFYLSVGIGEILNVIFPFRFIYLYMVMQQPEWAVIPLLVESATILIMEIPTGVVADRWGRKFSVITGGALYTLSLVLVPFAVIHDGSAQLWAVSLCFMFSGLGQTLVSGAEEAWVVDNLASANRQDLIEHYFARIQSFASVGGVGAGLVALAILLSVEVTRHLLDFLWYMAALGLIFSVLIASTIPEHRSADHTTGIVEVKTFLQRVFSGFQIIARNKGLLLLSTAIVIATFSGS
ncbi:MAG: MFS transporter, partial [Gammaproteobacteria bacterium]